MRTTDNQFICWAVGELMHISRLDGESNKELSFRVYYALKQTFPNEITRPYRREQDILDLWVHEDIRYKFAGMHRQDFRVNFLKLLIEKYGDVDLVI
jgi:hypothetical protein